MRAEGVHKKQRSSQNFSNSATVEFISSVFIHLAILELQKLEWSKKPIKFRFKCQPCAFKSCKQLTNQRDQCPLCKGLAPIR